MRSWGRVLGKLEIMYPDRQTDCWRNLTNLSLLLNLQKFFRRAPQFWAEVRKVLPDYEKQKLWLKEHGD